jgi:hypothetical protein
VVLSDLVAAGEPFGVGSRVESGCAVFGRALHVGRP